MNHNDSTHTLVKMKITFIKLSKKSSQCFLNRLQIAFCWGHCVPKYIFNETVTSSPLMSLLNTYQIHYCLKWIISSTNILYNQMRWFRSWYVIHKRIDFTYFCLLFSVELIAHISCLHCLLWISAIMFFCEFAWILCQ